MLLQSIHTLGSKNIIGRSEDCDIIILEEYVSRKAFQIIKKDNDFFLEKLSAKSLKLLGKSIKSNDLELLRHGDIIEIGSYEFIFQTKLDEALAETFDLRYLNNKKIKNDFYFLYLNIDRKISFYLFKNSFDNYINGHSFKIDIEQKTVKINNISLNIDDFPIKSFFENINFQIFGNLDSQNFFKKHSFYGFYSVSNALIDQYFQIWMGAHSDFPIFIHGETGVGKDVLANTIHKISNREGDFIAVNCSSIPDNLWETELFGHVKGAFTGAEKEKNGLFQLANNGTLFLDEIADMPLEQQAKLLRVLETQKVKKVGGEKFESINVRVISATHKNIFKLIDDEKFREDLLHRIYVLPITILPLRDRKNDIIIYANLFIRRINERMGTNKKLSSDAIENLTSYLWHGNVRELKNTIERAYIMSGDVITTREIHIFNWKKNNSKSLQSLIDQAILESLIKNKFNRKKTYEELEISRTKLYRWIDDNSNLLEGYDYE
jgi:transcriptional regulator with PAS, ATPase and Fis domain